MITAQHMHIMESLQKAKAEASKTKNSVLFSEVHTINMLDPLSFYKAGRKDYKGENFFWRDARNGTILAGIGKLDALHTSSGNRYQEIERKWKSLTDSALVVRETHIAATGPLLFGGFSFDSEKENYTLWDQFGDHLFYIPKYLLTIQEGQAYLTANLLVDGTADPAAEWEERNRELESIMEAAKNEKLILDANPLVEQTAIYPAEWKQAVQNVVDQIRTTELEKVVLARETRMKFQNEIQPEAVLKRLMDEQATSFIFCLESGSDFFIGASPEQLIKKDGNQIYSACLAGSIARGKTSEEDEALGSELLDDSKNRNEHEYVVSTIRNALEPVSMELDIPSSPVLMKTKHIQHLFTPVEGVCKPAVSVFDCVALLHPTPAMGGVPTQLALEKIEELEAMERGFYASPLGWSDGFGNGEFAVGIRSALVQGKEASLFAGCGVVGESVPQSEFIETSIKFKPMLSALGGMLDGTS
ncbi:isochorismate synthase [Peribacillus kribbensis]|uniref:isochorismate synthase n=1 Tax=Peribacillus kribbensis TaxID=356658 RepID=UPI00041E882D|nr:isochorismate synthase [Peribacillus kribbensis]